MTRTFKGPLGTEIRPRKLTNYLVEEETYRRWATEDWKKIELLCEEYGVVIDDDLYMNLTLALAGDFVPGFREKKTRGTKIKWTDDRLNVLVIEIQRIKRKRKCSTKRAAELLSNEQPWCNFLAPRDKTESARNPGESLRHQYNIQSKNMSAYSRSHFERLLEESEHGKWEAALLELFSRE